MDRKQRFNDAFSYLKGKGMLHTQKDLADKMKSTSPNISSALKGVETVLTDNFLRRFNAAYDNIFNEDWLLCGEGEMLRPSQTIGDVAGSTVVGANVNGSGNNISNSDAIALSKAIDEISKMREIVQEQVKNNQEQFDRFMAVIEKLTSR